MKKFELLVMVDNTGIAEFVLLELQKVAEKVICYTDFPSNKETIVQRISEADAVLVSWNTVLTAEILSQCPKLSYIGLCCTYFNEVSCNVDIPYCRERGIDVSGVSHYGDYGVVEYVISELIQMVKGLGRISFYEEQRELRHMKLGIIGLGTVGTLIAEAASFFGMDVSYYCRRKKDECLYPYMEKIELLRNSDVVLTSIPRNQIVMGEEEFSQMGSGKIFINVGVGPSFSQQAFEKWIANGNYAILDAGSIHEESRSWYQAQEKISLAPHVAGFTWNARKRLGKKVVENIKEYLQMKA